MTEAFTAPSRRHLLLGSLAALTAAAVAPEADARHRRHRLDILKSWPLGVQLWTVNDQLKTDVPGTLKAIKAAGYDVVETAGLQGHPAAEFRKMIEDAGLTCRSAHTSMGDLIDGLDAKIADAVALGAKWLVCSSPKPPAPLDPKVDWVKGMIDAMTMDAWKANADHLSQIAPAVAKAGLTLAYHNHPMEFIDHSGVKGVDILLTAADKTQLRLEMDLGWVAVSGQDPVAMMKKYADRLDLLHVKDMVRDAGAPVGFRSVEVGKGLIDWKGVFTTARALKVKGFFVEQEPPFLRPALTSLAMSHDYLKSL